MTSTTELDHQDLKLKAASDVRSAGLSLVPAAPR